jgi:hypothetical protein
MQSHTPNFVFGPNFDFATDSLFGVQNPVPATVVPVPVCFILSETGDFLISETGDFLILEQCGNNFVLTEPGDNVLTEPGDYVLIE